METAADRRKESETEYQIEDTAGRYTAAPLIHKNILYKQISSDGIYNTVTAYFW